MFLKPSRVGSFSSRHVRAKEELKKLALHSAIINASEATKRRKIGRIEWGTFGIGY